MEYAKGTKGEYDELLKGLIVRGPARRMSSHVIDKARLRQRAETLGYHISITRTYEYFFFISRWR